MSTYNAKTIDTNDIAQRVIDALSDFHADGLITGPTLRSKTNYTNLLKAINDADREVCRDSQTTRLVVVYAPPGQTSIPFDQNSRYLSDIIQGVQGADLEPTNLLYFLAKYDYINVVEIQSRYIETFSKYPTGSEQAEGHIRKVGIAELRSAGRGEPDTLSQRVSYKNPSNSSANKASFIPDENRLILGSALKDGGFLRFQGRIWPGIINTHKILEKDLDKENYGAYKIVAPHTAHAFLVNAAVYHSLPISSQNARTIAGQSMGREKRDYLKMKPSDSNVVVPHFHI